MFNNLSAFFYSYSCIYCLRSLVQNMYFQCKVLAAIHVIIVCGFKSITQRTLGFFLVASMALRKLKFIPYVHTKTMIKARNSC